MAHKFVVLKNGNLETYTEFDQIPWDFDHFISFKPDLPPPPHTEDQHRSIDEWNNKLQALMKIERLNNASRNKNR
jgi:hypothetical protein